MNMQRARILERVSAYYTERLAVHGPTARGVDWNSRESQELRFVQLLKLCPSARPFTLNDYGCGYGALLDCLRTRGVSCDYRGYDAAEAMIAKARELHQGTAGCCFVSEDWALEAADYTVASGIFNVKLAFDYGEWTAYMRDTVARLAELSTRGFAFNALTGYADLERRRPDLYYADPAAWFEYCRRFSRYVALLHDYPLYEFTILVRLGTE